MPNQTKPPPEIAPSVCHVAPNPTSSSTNGATPLRATGVQGPRLSRPQDCPLRLLLLLRLRLLHRLSFVFLNEFHASNAPAAASTGVGGRRGGGVVPAPCPAEPWPRAVTVPCCFFFQKKLFQNKVFKKKEKRDPSCGQRVFKRESHKGSEARKERAVHSQVQIQISP